MVRTINDHNERRHEWNEDKIRQNKTKLYHEPVFLKKNAEKIQKKANEKYGKENLSLVSHSQSGNIADNLAKKGLVGDENITLNPAIIGKHNKNLKVVKSSGDVVSALTFTNKKDDIIKSKTYNPLIEHSTKILGRGRSRKK